MLDPSGRFLRAFGSQGTADGKFNYPWGVTTDALGFIYVCDKENHRVQVCANILTYLNNNDYNWLNRCRFSNPMALLWVNSAHAAKKKASWNTHTTSPCRTPIALSSPIQTTIVFRYLMWMDACCPHSVLKAPKRDNSSSPGKYPHALLILHVLTIFYFFFVQQRRCGWWPRLHLCGRFGQQSHTNLPSWWKLLACFRLMGCRWCRIQGTWRCCYYVQWQHSGLRSWKSSRPGLLSKHIMIFRLFVSLFPKWCESLRIIAFRERFIFHFFHFNHKTTHS